MRTIKVIIALILFSSLAYPQAVTNYVRDRFTYTDGDTLNSNNIANWKQMPAAFTGDSAIYIFSGGGQAHNNLGTGRYGGAIWDSAVTNNGTDTLVFGFRIPQKGGATFITTPFELRYYVLMDTNTATWSGYCLDFNQWNANAFHTYLRQVTAGVAGGALAEVYDAVNQYSANDTLYVKIIGNNLTLYTNNATGIHQILTTNQPLATRGRMGVQLRVSSPLTRIDDFLIGSSAAQATVPSTRDTVKPIILSLGPNVAFIDTGTTFSISYHARDTVTALQKSTGLKRMVWRLKTIAGTQVDSQIVNLGATFDTTITKTGIKLPVGQYVMYDSTYDDTSNVQTYANQFGQSAQFTVGTAKTLWVTAYYGTWSMFSGGQTPDLVNYGSGVTHIIQFPNGNVRTTTPFWGPTGGVNASDSLALRAGPSGGPAYPPYQDSLVAKAHRAGVRVLVCMNAVWPENLRIALDSNWNGVIDGNDSLRCEALVQSAAGYISRHSLDGIDINIENTSATVATGPDAGKPYYPSVQHVGMMIRRLRAALNAYSSGLGGPMQITLSPTSGDNDYYIASVCNANVDQINPQTYDNQYAWSGCIGQNVNWYSGNIYIPRNSQLGADSSCFGAGNLVHSVQKHGANLWIAAGFSRAKMGNGVSTYGRLRMYIPSQNAQGNRVIPFMQDTTDGYFHTLDGSISAVLANGGTLQPYDTLTKSQSITGTAINNATYLGGARLWAGRPFYLTYPTPQVMTDFVQMTKDSSYGGIMLYEMWTDFELTNPIKNKILEAAAGAAQGVVVVSPPSAPTNLGPSNASVSVPVSGITFSWTAPSTATGYHYQIANDTNFTSMVTEFNLVTNSIISGQNPFNTSLSVGTKYYWRVNASNSGGSGTYSTPFSFTTLTNINPPSVPTRISPTNGSTVTTNTATLVISVSGSDTVTANIFQVKADTLLAPFVLDDSLTNITSKVTPVLTNGFTYFWRAASKNTAGKSAFTGWWRFKDSVVITVLDTLHQVGNWFDPTSRQWKNIPKGGETFQNVSLATYLTPPTSAYIFAGPLGYKTSDGVPHPYQTSDITQTANSWPQYQTLSGGFSTPTANISNALINNLSVVTNLVTDIIPDRLSTNVGLRSLGSVNNPFSYIFANAAYKVFLRNGSYTTDEYAIKSEPLLPRNGWLLWEDFLFNGSAPKTVLRGNTVVSAVGQGRWNVHAGSQAVTGGGIVYSTPTPAAGDSNHPGMMAITLNGAGTLGTANGGAFSFRGDSTFGTINPRINGLVIKGAFFIPSVADSMGYSSGLAAIPTDSNKSFITIDSAKAGVYVEGGGKLTVAQQATDSICAVASAGTAATRTKVKLITAVPNHWYSYQIESFGTNAVYTIWSDADNFTTPTTTTIVTNLPAVGTNSSPINSCWNYDASTTKQVKFDFYGLFLSNVRR